MAKPDTIALKDLPPEQRLPGNLPQGVSVQVNENASRTEMPGPTHQGAQGIQAFTRMQSKVDPSILEMNAYSEHLRDNTICFATYVPKNEKDKGHVYDFRTDGDRLRLINPGESVPIYFRSDVEQLKRVDVIRLSKKPLSKLVLDKEVELNIMPFVEITEMARALGVLDKLRDRTKPSLVVACLVAEFGQDEVDRNTKNTY